MALGKKQTVFFTCFLFLVAIVVRTFAQNETGNEISTRAFTYFEKLDITDDFNFANKSIHKVGSKDEFLSALKVVKPGGVILLQDGLYDNWGDVVIDVSGTREKRIVITAENPYGAVFKGHLNFNIKGDHLTFYGLFLKETNRWYDANATIFKIDGNYIRVCGCKFVGCSFPKERFGPHIEAVGDFARIDHNYMYDSYNKPIRIRYQDEKYAQGIRGHYLVDHNIFRDYRNMRKLNIQGETIMTGNGLEYRAVLQTGLVVEYNLFHYAEGDKHGEIFTDKSSENIWRHNMFAYGNCYGSLRHGNSKTVYGNVFYKLPTGLNVFNKNHLICNNFFIGCNNAITLVNGNVSKIVPMESMEHSGGSPFHHTEGCAILHNTIMSGGNKGVHLHSYGPFAHTSNVIESNIFAQNSGTAIDEAIDTTLNMVDNNLFCLTGTAKPGMAGENPVFAGPGFTKGKLPLAGNKQLRKRMGVSGRGKFGFDFKHAPYFPANLDEVKKEPLKAVIQTLPEEAQAFQPILIDAGASCGDIAEYKWDLGDGTVFSTREPVIIHIYNKRGLYRLRLTVVNEETEVHFNPFEIRVK